MNKSDFRTIRRKVIRGVNKGSKATQRGNKRYTVKIDVMPSYRCARGLRLKDCDLLV